MEHVLRGHVLRTDTRYKQHFWSPSNQLAPNRHALQTGTNRRALQADTCSKHTCALNGHTAHSTHKQAHVNGHCTSPTKEPNNRPVFPPEMKFTDRCFCSSYAQASVLRLQAFQRFWTWTNQKTLYPVCSIKISHMQQWFISR